MFFCQLTDFTEEKMLPLEKSIKSDKSPDTALLLTFIAFSVML